ncbi:MAG: hypothetical protein K6G58_03085 [Lachnospiraceae bacterium]|nr:hypothetical protein [Lachnospiraceae bacterium]
MFEKKTVYFTFDMDWAGDEVLADFHALLKECGVCATIHVTHDTPMLSELRKDDAIDLGIHPNYNPLLLEGSDRTVADVLRDIKKIVPEAVSLRSHALTAGSVIARHYAEVGIKYELNTYIPPRQGSAIFPYEAPIGSHLVLPFIFEDDLYLLKRSGDPDFWLGDDFTAPRIFNFHPIHLYLNTDSMETYERARPYFKDINELRKMRNSTEYGMRDLFIELSQKAKGLGYESRKIKDGDWD